MRLLLLRQETTQGEAYHQDDYQPEGEGDYWIVEKTSSYNV